MKLGRGEALREDISKLLGCGNILHNNVTFDNLFPYKMVVNFNMFRASMMNRIGSHISFLMLSQ